MNSFIRRMQQEFYRDLGLTALRAIIIVWCLIIIALTLVIKNKWVLAGILAYEVLP